MDEPIRLSDLIGIKRIDPEDWSVEKREAFWESVDREMERLGFDVANEITLKSTYLTERDYRIMVY